MIKLSKRPFAKLLAPGLSALGLVLFLLLPGAWSQEQNMPRSPSGIRLDTSGFDSLRAVLDYSTDLVEKPDKPAPAKEESSGFFEGLNAAAKVFFILFLIGLIVLFIWIIAEQFSKPSDKKVTTLFDEAHVDQLEENLPEADLLSPLEQALAAGDYNLAVRLLFLSYLKELILKGRIEWRQDKTNGEYLSELRGTDNFDEFARLTLVFERVWYGKATLSRAQYDQIAQQFKIATSRI